MVRKSVLVLLVVLVMQGSVRAQSGLDVQEAAVKAILAMGEFGVVRLALAEAFTVSRKKIADAREMVAGVDDAARRAELQAMLDEIISRIDFNIGQYGSDTLRYWDSGNLKYDQGCGEESLGNRSAAIVLFDSAEYLFLRGKSYAEELLLEVNNDIHALNSFMCHKLFYASLE